jgi:putative glutamine amidotransferase
MKSPALPLIGVTGPDRGGWAAWTFTSIALRRAGARAIRVSPRRLVSVERLHGLILGGGADVTTPFEPEPLEPPSPRSRLWPPPLLDLLLAPLVLCVRWVAGARPHGVDHARDRLEHELLGRARELGLPVLGICRGAQLMNVFEGGSLQQHVEVGERPQLYTVLPRCEIAVEQDSLLRRLLGHDRLLVNSLHFHAIDEPGRALRVVAREHDGIVQAIEHPARPFWLGVQWHPEYLPNQPAHQRLFHGLVHCARTRHGRERGESSRGSAQV